MSSLIEASVVAPFLTYGVLLLVQLLVADVAGIRAGHTPGTAVPDDHGQFHFRSVRALGNSNESVGLFLLIAVPAVLLVESDWLVPLLWAWVGARAGHMACYYANLQIARSVSFGLSLLALGGLALMAGAAALGA